MPILHSSFFITSPPLPSPPSLHRPGHLKDLDDGGAAVVGGVLQGGFARGVPDIVLRPMFQQDIDDIRIAANRSTNQGGATLGIRRIRIRATRQEVTRSLCITTHGGADNARTLGGNGRAQEIVF